MKRSRSLFTHQHVVTDVRIVVERTVDLIRIDFDPDGVGNAVILGEEDAADLLVSLAEALGQNPSMYGSGATSTHRMSRSAEDVLGTLMAGSIFGRLQEQAESEARDDQ